jgi:PEP-CTERM motif
MALSIYSRLAPARSSVRAAALAPALLAALLLTAPDTARAVPVTGSYVDDSRCDAVPSQSLGHEIGETTGFPLNERILVFVSQAYSYTCVGDDGAPNDFVVQMTNLSSFAYTDLFFVADDGILIGNADGTVEDVIGAPGIFADAFKIDGTVTVGANNPLMGESGTVNEIFEPGETWRFIVTNVVFPANIPPSLVFDSVGGFAGSSAGFPASTASILANQVVPEPSTALLVGLGFASLALARRRNA